MSVSAALSLLLAILKAIPILDKWFQKLVVAYTQAKIDSMEKENREAIKKALNEHDQRPIETAMGSSTVGEMSGNPGTTVVDSLPNVGVRKP